MNFEQIYQANGKHHSRLPMILPNLPLLRLVARPTSAMALRPSRGRIWEKVCVVRRVTAHHGSAGVALQRRDFATTDIAHTQASRLSNMARQEMELLDMIA